MRFGIVGLGRIGGGLSLQALEKGHRVVGYNRTYDRAESLAKEGLKPASEEIAQMATMSER